MQEHIRRAHPDYYIPKLPATEESFQLMITTAPTHRPPQQPSAAAPQRRGPCMSKSHNYVTAMLNSVQRTRVIMMPYSAILMVWVDTSP